MLKKEKIKMKLLINKHYNHENIKEEFKQILSSLNDTTKIKHKKLSNKINYDSDEESNCDYLDGFTFF